ncbi:MAG: hypothetical protein KF780_03855 [Sphingomonas sp.]|nr:hypothetical protein [Sphingomonas sp.]
MSKLIRRLAYGASLALITSLPLSPALAIQTEQCADVLQFPFAASPAADAQAGGRQGRISLGRVTWIALSPVETLTWARAPERVPPAGTKGAIAVVEIAEEGSYAIALSDGAWVDVVAPTGHVRSAGHGHGPACSGVRKVVDYRLAPGSYHIQLSGAEADRLRILVLRR